MRINPSYWLAQRGILFYSPLGTTTHSIINNVPLLTDLSTTTVDTGGIVTSLNGSSQYIEYASALGNPIPFTISIWGKPANTTVAHAAFSFGVSGSTQRHVLFFAGATANDPVTINSINGSSATAVTTAGFLANKFSHAVAVVASTVSRSVYLNGAAKGSNTTSINAFTPTRLVVGARINTTIGSYFSGSLAHALILPYALTDDEVGQLYDDQNSNPWQIIAARPPRFILIPDGAGGAVTLVIQKATHSHAADNVDLVQSHVLALADSFQSHSVESPFLSQAYALTLAAAAHAHNTDNISLIQAYSLNLNDALHSNTIDTITLSTIMNLLIANTLHSQTTESPSLVQSSALTPSDSLHSHAVDVVSIGQAFSLAVADSIQSHNAESPTLSTEFILSIQDALQNQASEQIALSTQVTLIVSDALHAHLAGSASEITLPNGDRIFLVAYEDRLFLVTNADRVFGV